MQVGHQGGAPGGELVAAAQAYFGVSTALVAVTPSTGAVRAYYGGRLGRGYFDDAAAARPPASTFKPIALAEGLLQGIAYLSRCNGTSPLVFRDHNGVPLRNHDNIQCPNCTLEQSMIDSLNTPFYALAERVGPARIARLAHDLGIPAEVERTPTLVDAPDEPSPGRTRADIAIGRYPVTPADLATAYATFAAGGVRVDRHMVTSVAGADGSRWYTARTGPPARAARTGGSRRHRRARQRRGEEDTRRWPRRRRQDRQPAVAEHQGQPGRLDGRIHTGPGRGGVDRPGHAGPHK